MFVMSTLRRAPCVVAAVATVLVAACAVVAPASAQNRPLRRGGPVAGDGVSPGEIQRLFDAYVVMQAQDALHLTDEQYPQFLTRVKALQTVRQRRLAERARILQELRRLDTATTTDDGQLRSQLKLLSDLDDKTAAEVRDAMAAIDQVLDVRQQARFRLFEDQMERRKVDLLMRARQANRQRNQP